jgi:hypothetical protein
MVKFDRTANDAQLQGMISITPMNLDLVMIGISIYVRVAKILPGSSRGCPFVDLTACSADADTGGD